MSASRYLGAEAEAPPTIPSLSELQSEALPHSKRLEKMVPQVQALGALGEDLDLVLSTIACHSSFRGSDTLFWSLQALYTPGAHKDKQTHIHNNKQAGILLIIFK